MAAELLFPAMGTSVQLMACGVSPAALQDARARIAGYEARWSRFLPESEVSAINANAGDWTPVSPDTFRLVEAAITGWEMTQGRFDPTVLGALVAAGYDRSFELLSGPDGAAVARTPTTTAASAAAAAATATATAETAPAIRSSGRSDVPGCGAIQLDEASCAVRVGPGTGIDLGGIAKGHTADLVVASLIASGATGALANLGGDIRVAGTPPVPPSWRIAANNPIDGTELATFGVADGAVVTSTRTRRRWTIDGVARHHLIDPQTGSPADTGLASVTVVAAQAVWAEVLAKAAFVAGPQAGAELITRFGATGVLIHDSGQVTCLPGIEDFLL